MEPLIIGGAIIGGAVWLGRKALKAQADRSQARDRAAALARIRSRDLARRRAALARIRSRDLARRRDELRTANNQARNLQLALLKLEAAPDFRRAASFAAQAKAVPLAFRRRQFQRFRTKIMSHFAARLRADTDAETLTASLTLLLKALGIAPYEAEYVRMEAERSIAAHRRPAPAATYADRLETARREHEERVTAIRNLPNTSDETREPLLEAEEMRYRESLQNLGNGTPNNTTTH